VKRRDFVTLATAVVAAWPRVARAQKSAFPTIGFLGGQSSATFAPFAAAFRQGLGEAGFSEGQNVAIEYRWADGHADRLPALAAELVRRRVDVIAAAGGVAAGLAAKAATTTIPIVFNSGDDPEKAGLVSSLNRPGSNLTGVSWFNGQMAAKRLAFLHELVPAAETFALMIYPTNSESATQPATAEAAARQLNRRLMVVKASTEAEIDAAFAALVKQRADALVVASGPFFFSRRAQLIALAARDAIPTISAGRYSPASGGLISYGNSLNDAYRRAARYVGLILKGEKAADLPIDQATKFGLVINLKTAKTLGLTVPPLLLATADEVIE
jgi:putative ABC transport system substrate-binding protein